MFPNSELKICKNVGIDNSYEHTIYFNNVTNQANFFSGKSIKSFTKYSYVRGSNSNDGYVKINIPEGQTVNCDYLMFKNTNYKNKWFYAFILGTKYINDGTTEIHFEIDVMQTWITETSLKKCFVEREHTATDIAGDYTLPEGLELGEYIITHREKPEIKDYAFFVEMTMNRNYVEDELGWRWFRNESGTGNEFSFGVIPSGYYVAKFPLENNALNGVNELYKFVSGRDSMENPPNREKVAKCIKNINAIYLSLSQNERVWQVDRPTKFTSAAGTEYTPRNKKLLTYPYMFSYVSSYNGGAVFPFEYFQNKTHAIFTTNCAPGSSCGIVITPRYYKLCPNGHGAPDENYDESFISFNIPNIAWNGDVYKQASARIQSSMPFAMGGILQHGAMAAVGGMMTGNPAAAFASGMIGLGASAATQSLNAMQQLNDAHFQSPHTIGNMSNISNLLAGTYGFEIDVKSIQPQFAKTIDDFFDRFGYKINRLKVPNRNVRPEWTYTKTIGCTVTGSIPAQAKSQIMRIYDKGITFWRNGNNVGHYELDNSV